MCILILLLPTHISIITFMTVKPRNFYFTSDASRTNPLFILLFFRNTNTFSMKPIATTCTVNFKSTTSSSLNKQ